MDEIEEDDFDQEAAELKAMNRRAWKLLVEKGYTSDQKLRLDFVFITESKTNALKLNAFFETETDYVTKVINNGDELEISGQTSELQLSLRSMNEWTSWMVEKGHECGCIFDGWSTPLISGKNTGGSLF